MKKKIIVSASFMVILTIGIVAGLSYKKYSNNKHYETIKMEIEEEAKRYLKVSYPYCTPGSASFTMNEETLLVQWAMDKKKLLDIDGKSYCKTKIEVMCVTENELDMDVYIKCKDYEDENYSNWEERHLFIATILEVNENSIMVKPVEGSYESKSSDKIIIKRIDSDNYEIGDKLKITYNGLIEESYPAQISTTQIEIIK